MFCTCKCLDMIMCVLSISKEKRIALPFIVVFPGSLLQVGLDDLIYIYTLCILC